MASVSHCPPTIDGPNPDLPFQTTPAIDVFDPMSWQIDDVPLDVVALVSSMGNQGPDGAVANGLSHGSLDPASSIWKPVSMRSLIPTPRGGDIDIGAPGPQNK